MSEKPWYHGVKWEYCGHERGGCHCMTVMAPDHPICVVTSGEWGDEYPSIRLTGPLLDLKAEAYMEREVYGEVNKDQAKLHAQLIADAPETAAERDRLAAENERLREAILTLLPYARREMDTLQKAAEVTTNGRNLGAILAHALCASEISSAMKLTEANQ